MIKKSTANDPNAILGAMVEEGEFAFDCYGDLVWRPDPARRWAKVSIMDGQIAIGDLSIASTEDLEEYITKGLERLWSKIGSRGREVLQRVDKHFLGTPPREIALALGLAMREARQCIRKLEKYRLVEMIAHACADGSITELCSMTWKGERLLMERLMLEAMAIKENSEGG